MYCPRLKHFVRLNQDGSIGNCGHMTQDIGFETVDQLHNSEWLKSVKEKMKQDEWPEESQKGGAWHQSDPTALPRHSMPRHSR